MKTPLISVILSSYNGTKYIRESIESVLNQSYTNLEFIIINDCSSDNTEDIISEYKKKDSRIIYIKNSSNLKLTASLNKGVEISQGKYIARIDDDDIWSDKDKLKKQVEFMESNTDYGICGTNMILINESWEEIGWVEHRISDIQIRSHISQSNQFSHSTIMMRKSILQLSGAYIDAPYNRYTEDYDLWLRIWIYSKFYNLEDYCVKYRVRPWSITWKKSLQQNINALRVYFKYRKQYPKKYYGLSCHIITIIVPKFLTDRLVKISKKFL